MNLLPKTRYSLLSRLADAADGQAWLEFQQIYETAIYRRARHQGLQEADALEVVQEVMLAVHRATTEWQRSDREGSFRAWLAETARRQTLQVMRRRQAIDRGVGGTTVRAAMELVADAPSDDGTGEEERWDFFCACARVEHEVQAATWRAFWLTAVVGRSAGDVAEELGWTVGNVYSAKCRVLAHSSTSGRAVEGRPMTRCDRTLGRKLLNEELSAPEEVAVVSHLDGCPQCREWLEQDAGEESEWRTARQLLSSSAELAYSHGEATPTSAHLAAPASLRERASSAGVDLSFLAPTDDPAYSGRIGGYEVVGLIGHGGMGIVLKAMDRTLNRHVAIKVLKPSLAGFGAARQRFAREARAMAALSHEHVVPVFAVDEHQGLPYLAMEYVAGGTLESRLRSEGQLDVVAIVRIALQVARALTAAHESGLVHRDIKPANILLERGVERVRVADFGLAQIAHEASCTGSGVLAGTPQFMAPEQVRGEACDGRADLFSLGSVVYAMCTGHEPFRAESVFGVLKRIVDDQPRSIREQRADIPAWLEEFTFVLLSKDKADRFQSAGEVAALLEQEQAFLQNPAERSTPARIWSPAKRFKQRLARRWIVGAAAALFVLAVAGSGVVWRMQSTGGGQAGEANDGVAAISPSRTPLWNDDGVGNVVAGVNALDLSMRADSNTASQDFWSEDIAQIQRQLAELNLEGP